MIFLMTDLDSPKTKDSVAELASASDEELDALLKGIDQLESLKDFTDLNGGGMNVNVEAPVDNDVRRYADVTFTASTKFTLDGYVYFANEIFAVSLRKCIEDVIAVVKDNR